MPDKQVSQLKIALAKLDVTGQDVPGIDDEFNYSAFEFGDDDDVTEVKVEDVKVAAVARPVIPVPGVDEDLNFAAFGFGDDNDENDVEPLKKEEGGEKKPLFPMFMKKE